MPKRTTQIYGNCKVYSPDGELMFLCLEKRINWYLKLNLAEIIDTNPLSIKLNFTPKGGGNKKSEYYLSEKRNACVCCNETDITKLTKHHVIPVEYRRHMPDSIKSRSSHDIVVMCQDCHYDYENNYAQHLKKELEDECFIERPTLTVDKIRTGKAYALAVLLSDEERASKIPKSRKYYMYNELKEVFGHSRLQEIVDMKLTKMMSKQDLEIGKEVLELQLSNEEFILMWRKHFIDSMNPQYLPTGWSIDTPIE